MLRTLDYYAANARLLCCVKYTMMRLPHDLLGCILQYTDAASIVAICTGHVYPLKRVAILHGIHTSDRVVQYLRDHPSNNLFFRYNISNTSQLQKPLRAVAANLCLPKLEPPRPFLTVSVRATHPPTHTKTSLYAPQLELVAADLKYIHDITKIYTDRVNAIAHDYQVKAEMLKMLNNDATVARTNREIDQMRHMYELIKHTSTLCNCVCGGELQYIRKTSVAVNIVCEYNADRVRRLGQFIRQGGTCRLTYGKHAGKTYLWTYVADPGFCTTVAEKYTRSIWFVPKKYTFSNYLYAMHTYRRIVLATAPPSSGT